MVPMEITKEFSYKTSNWLLMTISLEDIVFNTKLKTIVLIPNWRCYFNSKSHEMDPYSIPTFPIMMLFSLLHLLVLSTMPHTNIRNLTKVLSILTQLTTIINYIQMLFHILYSLWTLLLWGEHGGGGGVLTCKHY